MRQNEPGGISVRWRWLFWETLIIVLGVLIAFAVNDYWSARQDRQLELQYMKRLHGDLQGDSDWVTGYYTNAVARKMDALNAIAPVVRGKESVPEDVETFLKNVTLGAIGGASPNYFVVATTFEDLKATGNLRLIKDTEIRRKLNQYYVDYVNQHERILSRRTGYFMFVHAILPAELRQNMTIDEMREFGVERALEKILSPEFEDLLNQEFNFAYFIQLNYAWYMDRSSIMVEEVEARIRQLENQ
jgi:hypothetical protein